jgi:hypothetical protein
MRRMCLSIVRARRGRQNQPGCCRTFKRRFQYSAAQCRPKAPGAVLIVSTTSLSTG